MTKKGKLQEIFSRALYADDPSKYIITYRDFQTYKKISLNEFVSQSENFKIIPASRIKKIELFGQVLYEKSNII